MVNTRSNPLAYLPPYFYQLLAFDHPANTKYLFLPTYPASNDSGGWEFLYHQTRQIHPVRYGRNHLCKIHSSEFYRIESGLLPAIRNLFLALFGNTVHFVPWSPARSG